MQLTKHGIEAMGFTEYPETDTLEMRFGIIKAYSLRGILFEKGCGTKQSEIMPFGPNCRAVIAHSVNEASKLLTNDTFVQDEAKWLSERKAQAPFVLIYFQEEKYRVLRGGHRQEKDDCIYTYDAFPDGKADIREWQANALPNIVTALAVHLSTLDRQVILVPLETSVFGTTRESKRVFDLKVAGSASGYVSSPRSLSDINSALEKAQDLASDLTTDVSRNFYAALNEDDRLKQFLGFFLFIERFTHSTYKTLSYDGHAHTAFNIPARIEEPTKRFFERFFQESKTLSQRFHWCAMLAWQTLDAKDIDVFLEIKRVRDALTHGEHIEESTLPVERAKTLALKLLGTTGGEVAPSK